MNPRAAWTLVVGAIVGGAGLALSLVWTDFNPTPPNPVTAAELAAIEARFKGARPILERIVEVVPRKLEDQSARIEELMRATHPALQYVGIRSDSLIYVRAFSRRGVGASAGWVYAGYVYSSQWPRYAIKRLDENWFLHSEETGPG